MRASSHVLYLLSIVESTEPKQVYGVKLDFVSERTIKEHHHQVDAGYTAGNGDITVVCRVARQGSVQTKSEVSVRQRSRIR